MITTSKRAVKKLKDEMIQKCLNVGLGYRIIGKIPESGRTTLYMELDKEHSGDEVIMSDGIRLFLDPTNAALLKDYKLDFIDGPTSGFCLIKDKVKTSARSQTEKHEHV
jgi:Fe-S cluster assembly iron-binding protein IscA